MEHTEDSKKGSILTTRSSATRNTRKTTTNGSNPDTKDNTKVSTTTKNTQEIAGFPILDETPEFKAPPGRSKSALRIAMEGLEVGQSIVAGTLLGEDATKDDGEAYTAEERDVLNKRQLAATRGKAQEISKDEDTKGHRYSVRVDVQDRVIVTRVADHSKNS